MINLNLVGTTRPLAPGQATHVAMTPSIRPAVSPTPFSSVAQPPATASTAALRASLLVPSRPTEARPLTPRSATLAMGVFAIFASVLSASGCRPTKPHPTVLPGLLCPPCNQVPSTQAPTCSLTSTPQSDGSFLFEWQTQYACTITFGDEQTPHDVSCRGSSRVTPSAPTYYFLTATGPGGICSRGILLGR